MIAHFKDASSLSTGSLHRRDRIHVAYGTRHTMEFKCTAGPDMAPVDVQSRGLRRWELRIVRAVESPAPVLASASFSENVAAGSVVSVDFTTATEAMYRYVAGQRSAPGVFELLGYEGRESSEAVFALRFPVELGTASGFARPPSLNDAVLQEIYDARNRTSGDLAESREHAETALSACAASESARDSTLRHASDARAWAEGQDADVEPLEGTHSARGWCAVAEDASASAAASAQAASASMDESGRYALEARNSMDETARLLAGAQTGLPGSGLPGQVLAVGADGSPAWMYLSELLAQQPRDPQS